MLHILLLILKIIGIILLSVLGILILALGSVLFVPARYRIELKGTKLVAKASWFFRLLSAYFVYENQKSDWQVRIVWKKLNVPKNEKEEETPCEEECISEERQEECEEEADEEAGEETDKQHKSERKENVSKTTKKESLFHKLKCTIQKICDMIKKAKQFLKDDIHIAAFKKIKREILVLLNRIRPRKIKGYIEFGLEDPYQTGQILAGLSILYPMYGESIQIYPDFEKKVFEGDLFIKGRIHVVTLVVALCNIFLDKNVRKTYHDYKRIKG